MWSICQIYFIWLLDRCTKSYLFLYMLHPGLSKNPAQVVSPGSDIINLGITTVGYGAFYPNYDVTSWTPNPCRDFWSPRVVIWQWKCLSIKAPSHTMASLSVFLHEGFKWYNFFVSRLPLNLTTVSKNTYVTGFLGSFQTPNPRWPPYNKYVIYLTTYPFCPHSGLNHVNSKSIQPLTKLGTIYALRGLKRPQITVVRLKIPNGIALTDTPTHRWDRFYALDRWCRYWDKLYYMY